MQYTVDYFIKKFKAIPERKWTVKEFRNWMGQRCAMGHCLPDFFIDLSAKYFSEGAETLPEGLCKKYINDLRECEGLCLIINKSSARTGSEMVIKINNGDDPRYQQSTPKQRILAALNDIKRLQQPEVKEIIKYVAVDAEIREQAQETLLTEVNN